MTEPLLFRILFAALLIGFVTHRAYYTRKYPPRETETLTRLSNSTTSKAANLLALLALISSTIYIIAPSYIAWASIPLPPFARWLGAGIALTGFLLLESSHRALASNWSDQPRIMQSQQFIRTGPYKRIRHPIYTSFLMILGSSLLITSNWLVGLLWIASVGLDISARIRFEERAMQEQFGQEFVEYKATTGSLFPRL
jgi:protein-S-isoprenylcysteine O-methyltransferase Ste14